MNRVLIVDDSPGFRTVAAGLLAEHGFDVVVAADGEQALAVAARECPDGVLLDVNLPDLDGFAVATALAAACPAARIVLTSADMVHVQAEVLESCGVAAFVPKQDLVAAGPGTLFRPAGK